MRGTVCYGCHRHGVIYLNPCGLPPTAGLCLDVALDALQGGVGQEKVNGRSCVFGNEFDSSQDGSDGCRAFFS